jgi:hypothetical protein
MKRNRFQVLFYLRKSRKNKQGEFPIYMRVTVNGKNAVTSTGQYVAAKYWNQKKNLAKPAFKEAESINDELNKLLSDVRKDKGSHTKEGSGSVIRIDTFSV